MEKLPIGPCAGSCGTAAYRGSPVIVSDIASDPLWEVPAHRAAALSHGLRASWSNPILSSEGKVLGTFCIYGREPQSPSPHDLGVMEKATHLARVAIERDRAEAAVRTSEEKYRDLINASPDAICVVDADGKCILVNPAGVNLAGRSQDELIGSSITDTYLAEERHLLANRLEKLKAEGSFRFERKFLRKNGEIIPVEVSLSALRGRYYQAFMSAGGRAIFRRPCLHLVNGSEWQAIAAWRGPESSQSLHGSDRRSFHWACGRLMWNGRSPRRTGDRVQHRGRSIVD